MFRQLWVLVRLRLNCGTNHALFVNCGKLINTTIIVLNYGPRVL